MYKAISFIGVFVASSPMNTVSAFVRPMDTEKMIRPKEKYNFPTTLDGFGYKFNKGRILIIVKYIVRI